MGFYSAPCGAQGYFNFETYVKILWESRKKRVLEATLSISNDLDGTEDDVL